ncbi:MAG: hypothetical protein IPO04_11015 [Cytophagaceae bacterium]|nr:hypothetical protein [Cytophagaceae bacterium]
MGSYKHACFLSYKSLIVLWSISLFSSIITYAQSDTLYINSQTLDIVEIKNYSEYYVENGTEKSMEDILVNADFQKYDWLNRDLYRNNNVWIKFCIKNNLVSDTLKLSAYFG